MFNLKKKLEEGIAQINPFDHGATASTVRAKYARQASVAPAASTVRSSNRPNFQNGGDQSQQSQPSLFQRTLHTFASIPHEVEQHAGDIAHGVLNSTPLGATANAVMDIAPKIPAVQNFVHNNPIGRADTAITHGLERSAVGTGQAASGLYDLATPGTGTNRASDLFDQTAKDIDAASKANHDNGLLYHGSQLAGDALQYAVGAGEAKAAAEAATRALPAIPKVVQPVLNAGTHIQEAIGNKVAPLINEGNVAQRVVGRTIENAAKPGYQAVNAAYAGTQAAKEASQGEDVSPTSVLENVIAGGVGLPAVGAVAHEAAAPAVKAVTEALREQHLVAPSRLNPQEVADLSTYRAHAGTGALTDEGVYERGVAAARRAGLNHTDTDAIDRLLGAHRTYHTRALQRRQAVQEAGDRLNPAANGLLKTESGHAQFGDAPEKMYKTVHQGGVEKDVPGEPVKIADGLETFVHKDENGNWVVSEATTGRSLTSGGYPDKHHAVSAAKSFVNEMGPEKVKAKISEVSGKPHAESKAPEPAPLDRSDSSEPMTKLSDAVGAKVQKLREKGPKAPEKVQKPPKNVDNGTDLPIPGDIEHTNNIGPEKRTRFTEKTVQKSDEVSEAVKAKTDATYTSDTMKNAAQRTDDYIAEHGEEDSLGNTLKELNSRRGTASRDTLDRAIELAIRHDEKGGAANEEMAERLYELVGEHGSASGQQSQILARIAARSPAGLRNKAFRDLKKWGVDLESKDGKKIKDEIQGHIDAIKALPDGPEKDWAVATLQKEVLKHKPQSVVDQGISLWKAGLLSGVKTHGGNIISNATFGGLKKASDPLAAGIDQVLSLRPGGVRTKTFTGKGIRRGTVEGLQGAKKTLKTGIDTRNVGDKYEQHAELNTNSKALKPVFWGANRVFRLLSAADQPTYYATLKNSLYDQAKADGLNNGKRGIALLDHMDELVKNPTETMLDTSEKEANKSVLAYDTFASKAINGLHKGIDSVPGTTDAQKAVAHSVISVLAPFVRVPSAFISRTVDFTPFGVGKEVFSQVAHKKFDQRQLSQAISEGLTGTGAIALGIALTQHKLIAGDYPKNDPKEAARWKAEGITPNSVKLGNTWVSLNYMGPLGLLFNAGNQIEKAKGASLATKAGQAVAGLGQGLMGQSFVQGFSGFSDAIQDPQRSAKSFINSEASSLIPSISNDIANLTDKNQRTSDSVGEAVKNRIPGLRHRNDVKTDVYGNPLKQPSTGLNPINPLRPSDAKTSAVLGEVERLHNVDVNNSDLQVTPVPVDRTLTVDKQSISLTDKQRRGLQTAVGQQTQKVWGEAIKSEEYKSLDDIGKAKMLNNLRTDASALAQRKYVTDNKLASYSKSATNRQTGMATGDLDLSAYVSGSNGGNNIIKDDNRGTALISHVNSMNTDQQKEWATKKLDPKFNDLYERSSGIVPKGLPKLPKTNATLQAYATYLKTKNDNKSGLETNKAKKTFLKDSYGSGLSTNSKDLLGQYTIAEKLSAIANGEVSKRDLSKSVEYDNFLLNSGLASTPKISNTIRRKYGLGTAPKHGSGRGRGGKGSRGGSKNKLTYDLFSKGVDPVGYNKKLRQLINESKVTGVKS